MIRGEHSIIRYDFAARRAYPDRLYRRRDANYAPAADAMVSAYRDGVGTPREQLHDRVRTIARTLPSCPTRRVNAFCKLLDDAGEFHSGSGSAELRRRVFETAADWHPIVQTPDQFFEVGRDDARQKIAQSLNMSWQTIEAGCFADVIELQRLRRFDADITGGELLARYNLAQTQAALYRASRMRLSFDADHRRIVRAIKLAGLMHRIDRSDDGPTPTYHVTLDGPESVLRQSTRYGVRFAKLLGMLVRRRGWSATAQTAAPDGGPMRIELSDRDGLQNPFNDAESDDAQSDEARSDGDANDGYASEFERRLAKFWTRRGQADWQLEHETELLSVGQTVYTPDFVLRRPSRNKHMPRRSAGDKHMPRRSASHNHPEQRILVEALGFWTPEYLTDKADRLVKFVTNVDAASTRWLIIFPPKSDEQTRRVFEDLGLPTIVFNARGSGSDWIAAAGWAEPDDAG